MYMIRGTWRAQRGKAPMIIDALKMVNQAMTSQAGFSNGKIYADMSGPFDTVIWQFEAESLDRFYQAERGVIGKTNGIFAPAPHERSAGGGLSAARRSAARSGLDRRRRRAEGRVSGVAWGEDLGTAGRKSWGKPPCNKATGIH